MQLENYYPFLLIMVPFAIAYFAEALVIYLFRLKPFWAALGISLLTNFLSLAVLYGSSILLGKLGYSVRGLQLPVQVMLFFWWLSVLTDGLLLQLLTKREELNKIYLCSIVMNSFSWLFLYMFVTHY